MRPIRNPTPFLGLYVRAPRGDNPDQNVKTLYAKNCMTRGHIYPNIHMNPNYKTKSAQWADSVKKITIILKLD